MSLGSASRAIPITTRSKPCAHMPIAGMLIRSGGYFCRGDLEYIQRIAKGMKIFLSLKGHQDYLIVIDKAGNIRKMLDGTSEIECNRLHKVLLECLEEKAPDDNFGQRQGNRREIY